MKVMKRMAKTEEERFRNRGSEKEIGLEGMDKIIWMPKQVRERD